MSIVNGMSFRAITQRQAEWIGMAASVAGGYVAVNGTRLSRVESPPPLRNNHDDYDFDCHQKEWEYIWENYPYDIQGGDHAGFGGECLVLCVPAGGPLCKEGWSIPAKMVADWLEQNPQYRADCSRVEKDMTGRKAAVERQEILAKAVK